MVEGEKAGGNKDHVEGDEKLEPEMIITVPGEYVAGSPYRNEKHRNGNRQQKQGKKRLTRTQRHGQSAVERAHRGEPERAENPDQEQLRNGRPQIEVVQDRHDGEDEGFDHDHHDRGSEDLPGVNRAAVPSYKEKPLEGRILLLELIDTGKRQNSGKKEVKPENTGCRNLQSRDVGAEGETEDQDHDSGEEDHRVEVGLGSRLDQDILADNRPDLLRPHVVLLQESKPLSRQST